LSDGVLGIGNKRRVPHARGREDDDRSYSDGHRPSTPVYPLLGSVAIPLEEIMRLIDNVMWLVFGGRWMGLPLGKEIVPA
jgi:hypothetical protein